MIKADSQQKNIFILSFISLFIIAYLQLFNFDIRFGLALKVIFLFVLAFFLGLLAFADESKLEPRSNPPCLYLGLLTLIVGLACIIYFKTQWSFKGDNCWYLLNVYQLGDRLMAGSTMSTGKDLICLGFATTLSPFFKIFGLNFIILKISVFLTPLLVPYAAYWVFRDYIKGKLLFPVLLLLTLNSQLIHFSPIVMTKTLFTLVLLVNLYLFTRILKPSGGKVVIKAVSFLSGQYVAVLYSRITAFVFCGNCLGSCFAKKNGIFKMGWWISGRFLLGEVFITEKMKKTWYDELPDNGFVELAERKRQNEKNPLLKTKHSPGCFKLTNRNSCFGIHFF